MSRTRSLARLTSAGLSLAAAALVCSVAAASEAPAPRNRPNVVLIMTDDQGYGDLGVHGNPKISTPNLDRLAAEGVELTHFYVSPVCSPTRASLLTGRFNYRTGVVDTFLGRALMHPDEVTLAEMLRAAGFRTGVFGKWHLGDNYPLRPIDQGFDEALVNRGGGIGQPSDPPGGNHYLDPILQHNGREQRTGGYVSDAITDAALRFIEKDRTHPFFVYLAFNCPHTPLEAPENAYRQYQNLDLSAGQFPAIGNRLPERTNTDDTARVYAMVTNIDDNMGRLLARLDEWGLGRDTIVVFLTDNGPQQPRFNAGLRGRKGTVYEGGIRVPCFVRWPARLQAGQKIDTTAAHIDLTPTLLAACGVKKPDRVALDGVDLLPLLTGDKASLPERTLCFQWHRGDVPEMYRACAARRGRYKLVQSLGAGGEALPTPLRFELFDIEADPFEMRDLAANLPEVVTQLRSDYENWFRDVSATRGYEPPRIALGTAQENPVVLTRQDWRGEKAGWGLNALGHWQVDVAAAGSYDVTLRFAPVAGAGKARFSLGGVTREITIAKGDRECGLPNVRLEAGVGQLQATTSVDGQTSGVQYVEVRKVE